MTTRSRTRGGFSTGPFGYRLVRSDQPTPPWSGSPANYCSGTYETMTDVVTSNFTKLRRGGGIFNNPMWKTSTTVSQGDEGFLVDVTSGGVTYTWECSGNWCAAQYGPPVHYAFPSTLALEVEADTAAASRVVKPDVQGLVTLAELPKTMRMLLNPASALRKLIESRVRKSRGRESFSDAARNSWLEARYGWRPFLLEMESILDTLGKGYSERMTARATRTRSLSQSWTQLGTVSGFNIPFTFTSTQNVTIRSGVLYNPVLDMGANWGVTWRDIPSAAWELVPYSFVADWFVNIGQFIEAVTPRPGINYLASWRVVEIETSTKRSPGAMDVSGSLPGWTVRRSPSRTDSITSKSVIRVPSLHPPMVVFKEGSLRSVLSDWRSLDAIALFISSLSGKTPKGKLRL